MSTSRPTLVLGGSGFLGVHVVAEALARTGDVVSASREPGGAVAAANVERARFATVDALRAGAVEDLIAASCPSHVVLCTSLSVITECERYPVLARTLNVDLPARVARATSRCGARLVLVSTDLVFGAVPPPPHGFDEMHATGPVSEYGRSKCAGEDAALAEDPTTTVVRLPLLTGESFGRGIGASDSILAAVARREPPCLFADEWRTPLDVRCAARALVEIAFGADIELAPNRRLHLAGHERMSRAQLGARVLATHGISLGAMSTGTRRDAGLEQLRPEDTALDARRAAAVLATPLFALRTSADFDDHRWRPA
jgi:dTDP-4-dehydrorhamnose reductase